MIMKENVKLKKKRTNYDTGIVIYYDITNCLSSADRRASEKPEPGRAGLTTWDACSRIVDPESFLERASERPDFSQTSAWSRSCPCSPCGRVRIWLQLHGVLG